VEKEADPFGKHVLFSGFNGNDESSYMRIARFLIERMGEFPRFKGRDLNSGMSMLSTYRRMLNIFEPILGGLLGEELDATQVIRILKSRRYN
jgi:uncharacterized protein YfbU (UPF0304 family)